MVRIDFDALTFVVIDDSAPMRRIVRTVLHGFGSRHVYEAEDGAAGLEAFLHYAPDIIIADWVMPVFGGLELTGVIRQPGSNPNPFVPIILLTGYTEKSRVMEARDAGVTEFLAKPFSPKALYQTDPQHRDQPALLHQIEALLRAGPAAHQGHQLHWPGTPQGQR